MAENSKIQWCDHTFSPWWGCTKVSAGCKNCYASNGRGAPYWGKDAPRKFMSDSTWKKPLTWNKYIWVQCVECGWRGQEKEALNAQGFKNNKCPNCKIDNLYPARQRVFCGSMCDIFEDREDLIEPRERLFDLIDMTPNLDWLLLTKRPENIKRLWPWGWYDEFTSWPNIWMGTTTENQAMADKRIPILLNIPAKIRWLSCEPLLGKIDLAKAGGIEWDSIGNPVGKIDSFAKRLIDWVIVGGESGSNARPIHPNWAKELLSQCKDANIPYFFKQWGEWIPQGQVEGDGQIINKTVRVSDVEGWDVWRVGKDKAGDLLDGEQYHEFPNTD